MSEHRITSTGSANYYEPADEAVSDRERRLLTDWQQRIGTTPPLLPGMMPLICPHCGRGFSIPR